MVKIDCQKGLDVFRCEVAKCGHGSSKSRILVKIECRVYGSGRLPGSLIGDLFYVSANDRFDDLQLTRIDPETGEQRIDVGRPVNEPEMAPQGPMVILTM